MGRPALRRRRARAVSLVLPAARRLAREALSPPDHEPAARAGRCGPTVHDVPLLRGDPPRAPSPLGGARRPGRGRLLRALPESPRAAPLLPVAAPWLERLRENLDELRPASGTAHGRARAAPRQQAGRLRRARRHPGHRAPRDLGTRRPPARLCLVLPGAGRDDLPLLRPLPHVPRARSARLRRLRLSGGAPPADRADARVRAAGSAVHELHELQVPQRAPPLAMDAEQLLAGYPSTAHRRAPRRRRLQPDVPRERAPARPDHRLGAAAIATTRRVGRAHHAPTAGAVLALALAGCADVDFTVNEDGSGTFNVTFNAPNAQPDVRQLVSSHVKVRSISRSGVSVILAGTFDDVTKLSTAQALRGFTIVRRQLRQDERIRVVFLNRRIERVPPSQRGV